MKKIQRYIPVTSSIAVGILLFLLAFTSENSAKFDRYYPWLLGLNALVAIALLAVVGTMLTRLYIRYKRGQFGSKLMARLVRWFALIGVLPGILIYLVSVQFVSRSIESWFNVKVESALEAGLNLGRSAMDAALSDLMAKGRNIALELSDLSKVTQITQLSRLREQSQIQEAAILSGNGHLVANAGSQVAALLPNLPTITMLRQARKNDGFSVIESETDDSPADQLISTASTRSLHGKDSLRMRVIVEIPAASDISSLKGSSYFLQLLQPMPPYLAANAEALRTIYSEYQERSLGRTGLRNIYLVSLTLTLLLAIFAAIASAFFIANELASPLLLLVEATKAVSEGDLSPRSLLASRDELGVLTQSFNKMTRQLFEARASVEKNRTELENAKTYLESVLANMSAGVMVLDSQFTLLTCNQSVGRILQKNPENHIGKPLASIEGMCLFTDIIIKIFSEQNAHSFAGGNAQHWQKQIEIPRLPDSFEKTHRNEMDDENVIALLTRGSRLPVASGSGYLVVFDDISDVISAQRSLAWREVARRLAHEIKNPLTPIQLSAERLQMKLAKKLAAEDAAILEKSTHTIINQVSAMKHMVDDFRDYAKTPPLTLSALNLNALIEEILQLYLAEDGHDIIHVRLAPILPEVMGDATQMRQVIHNLLQNAQDAAVENASRNNFLPHIEIKTEEFRYHSSTEEFHTGVRMTITDNGSGFAPKIMARAFEPYITTKPRGTGLGLAMVKKIIEEHGGRVDIRNRNHETGAEVSVLLLKLA